MATYINLLTYSIMLKVKEEMILIIQQIKCTTLHPATTAPFVCTFSISFEALLRHYKKKYSLIRTSTEDK